MRSRFQHPLRWLALAIVAATAGACNLTLSMDQPTTPQIIYVTATPDSRPAGTPERPPDSAPTVEAAPTLTSIASEAPVTMTAGQDLSCVQGPHWALFEWVTKVAKGETVTLLARASEEWEEYYYVRKADGTECWAFGGSSTKMGNTALLSVREAPPLPEVDLVIENQTGLHLIDIFIREGDSADWGGDRLGASFIPLGGSYNLTLTAGFYDIKVNDFMGGALLEKHDTPIGVEASTRHLAVNSKFDFYIQNNTGVDLCSFQFRQAPGGGWEMLHGIADGAIGPGERLTLNLLPAFYDYEIYQCAGPMVDHQFNIYFGPAIPGINTP